MERMGAYRNTNWVRENESVVWCVAFNFVNVEHRDLFASVSGNKASIYRCEPHGGITLLQAYVDENRDEEFFACKWSYDEEANACLLLVAGKNNIMRVLDVSSGTLLWTAQGHGDPINDIAVHPLRPHLALTASRDQSLRLWNLKSKVCIAILSGEGGHRNEILSIDFHPTDVTCLVSSGMDNAVKIWSLKDVARKLEEARTWTGGPKAFKPGHVTNPVFSSHKVHGGYVDCVRWMGELVVSKSVDNRILVWRPLPANSQGAAQGHIHFVQELALEDANMWFIRFSTDYHCKLLACGSRTGRVLVWDMAAVTPHAKWKVKRPMGNYPMVRQTALSYDGSVLLFCCDDGTIWRFDADGVGSSSDAA